MKLGPARVGAMVWLVGCGEAPSADNTTTTASAGTVPASAKPQCLDPNTPSGAIPAARADTSSVLTANGTTMVMFGGDVATVVCGDTPKRNHVGDTWLLDVACGGWSELATTGPSARARHVMAGDYGRNRALLFGGRFRDPGKTGDYTLYNDLWAFDFGKRSWSQVETSGSAPSPRANATMIVDADTLWIFGGNTSSSALTFAPENDLYALDLQSNTWQLVPATGAVPAKRLFHAMALDSVAHRAYVAYGGDANAFVGPFFKDVAALDLATATFTSLDVAQPQAADFGRIKLGMMLRPGDGNEPRRLFAFGGHDDLNVEALGNRNDLLTVELATTAEPAELGPLQWQRMLEGDRFNQPAQGMCAFPADFVTNDSASIERRSAFAFAALPSGEAFVVFAGDSDCGRLSDVFWFDTRAGRFEAINESLPGLTCPRTGNTGCKSLCG